MTAPTSCSCGATWSCTCSAELRSTSHSQANRTLLFDVRRERWSERMLSLSGVDEAKLPTPVPSGTPAGTVSQGMARKLGLPPGVQLAVGSHDQCCNALGAGIVEPGKGGLRNRDVRVHHAHLRPGFRSRCPWCRTGSTSSTTWSRACTPPSSTTRAAGWCDGSATRSPKRNDSLPGPTSTCMTCSPARCQPSRRASSRCHTSRSPGPLLSWPTPRGSSRASSWGRPGEILKSIRESATLYLAEGVRALSVLGLATEEFVATGGGARSDLHGCEIKADVFGVPFVRAAFTEGGVLGLPSGRCGHRGVPRFRRGGGRLGRAGKGVRARCASAPDIPREGWSVWPALPVAAHVPLRE